MKPEIFQKSVSYWNLLFSLNTRYFPFVDHQYYVISSLKLGQAVLERRRLIPDPLAVSTFDYAWKQVLRTEKKLPKWLKCQALLSKINYTERNELIWNEIFCLVSFNAVKFCSKLLNIVESCKFLFISIEFFLPPFTFGHS